MSVHLRAPAAARSQQEPSRLDAVLRSGQARRAAELRTGTNPNLRPPMNITELPTELKQLVTKRLAASNPGNATSLCSDLQAWCRAHPVACEDPSVWRAAFEAIFFTPLGPAPPAPPPLPAKPTRSDFGLPEPESSDTDSASDSDSDPDDDGPSLPQPGGGGQSALSDERQAEKRRRYELFVKAMQKWHATKLAHDTSIASAQDYANRLAFETAKRAALAASPPASYKGAFTTACMAIDQVRKGNPEAIRNVHLALLQSESFMKHVAMVDPRVIRFAVDISRDIKEKMWKDSIRANPRHLRYAGVYSPWHDYDGADIPEYDVVELFRDQPEIIQYLDPYFILDTDLWDLRGALRDNPLLLQYMTNFNFTDDECLMLELAKENGRSLEYMSKKWQSNKRIVLAALKTGPDVYKFVEGNALRRDPDVRKAAGLKPLYKWPRVPRNRDEEVACTDDSDSDSDSDSDDDEKGEDHGKPSNAAASSDEELESPTSSFNISLRARDKDDSSSDEEDVTHGLDAANVRFDETEDWEEDASPPQSPMQGDYPDYDVQRGLDKRRAARAASS